MNVDTSKMKSYAHFLEDGKNEIGKLCDDLQECLEIAKYCMDKQSGAAVAAKMEEIINNIRQNLPALVSANERLTRAAAMIEGAVGILGKG